VKHSDDENELFHRPEAEMTDDSGAEVVDLGKARTARLGPV
jgi:S-DNA-T family DNA segregation ATPase FtsK/SpoIIIE